MIDTKGGNSFKQKQEVASLVLETFQTLRLLLKDPYPAGSGYTLPLQIV